MIRKDLTPLV